MSSNSESNGMDSNPGPSLEVNQDDKILAQKEAIEDEIKRSTKLVGDKTIISVLQKEFSSDPVYLEKVTHLSEKFSHFRRTRPDGNCFYRALGFAYLEHLLNDSVEFSRFRAVVQPTKDQLAEAGFPTFTSEDFYDTFMDTLDRLQPKSNKSAKTSEESAPASNSGEDEVMSHEDLVELFNEEGTSNYLVVFLRLLTSMQIRKEAEFYQNFMVDGQTVADFCNLEVEPMYHESDHIHVTALAQLTGVPVQIIYLDRGNNKEASTHTFPEDCKEPLVYLLYRPGHYDIAYPKK